MSENRIAQLGRLAKSNGLIDAGRPACNYVASRGPAILKEFVSGGLLNANNDGHPYDVTVGSLDGSAGGELLVFRPKGAEGTSPPIEIKPDGFEWKDYSAYGARWLPHGDRVYTPLFHE
jgi:hypothetical protein